MPAVGNGEKAGPYDIPENYATALRAGIRFYVCRYPKRGINSRTIFGFFDVKVGEQVVSNQNDPVYNERWLTGADANIIFQQQGKSEILIAFIPDDRFYHNKMMIAEHPWLIVEGMYSSSQGMISSQEAIIEIQAVRETTYTTTKIYKVMWPNGNEETFFFDKSDAEKFIVQKVHRTTNAGFPYEATPYTDCTIQEDMYPVRKPEIIRLLNEHRNEPYGWTNCAEFKSVWIPKIEALITERKQNISSGVNVLSQPGAIQQMVNDEVMKIIRTLSPDQIAMLKSTPRPETATAEVIDNPTEDSQDAAPIYTKSELTMKRIDELREMAKEMGLEVGTMKKAEIADLIFSAQSDERQVEERASAEPVTI